MKKSVKGERMMKVLMGVTVCFLDLPVLAWLCYRCLEREQEVWRKGKWFLTLMLLVYGGASGYRYWQGKETALNNANKYRNEKMPEAEAQADQIIQDAEAEK